MGSTYLGIPTPMALKLKALYDLEYFVETGTYSGRTAAWASHEFKQVYTIEASELFWRQASQEYAAIPNVQFIQGNSAENLEEVVRRMDAPAIYWLDAHWSGGATYGAQEECPLLAELEALSQSTVDQFVLIDDARYFIAPPQDHIGGKAPSISQVIHAVERNKTDPYTIIVDEVIVSVPAYAHAQLAEYYQDRLAQSSRRQAGVNLIRKGLSMLWKG